MTPLDLAREVLELDAKATLGPWILEWIDDYIVRGERLVTVYADTGPNTHGLNLFGRIDPDAKGRENLALVTRYRTLAPKLARAIIELTERLERRTGPPDPEFRKALGEAIAGFSQFGMAGAGIMADYAADLAVEMYGARIAEQDAELTRLRAIEAAAKARLALLEAGDWDGSRSLLAAVLLGEGPE